MSINVCFTVFKICHDVYDSFEVIYLSVLEIVPSLGNRKSFCPQKYMI